MTSKTLAATTCIAAGLLLVYWQVLVRLVEAWIVDGNYSHGFLIVPIAAYLAWERREALRTEPITPTWLGLLVFSGSILVLLAGLLGSELFLSRISLIGTLAGIVLFLFGWRHLRILTFPLLLLVLMIPLPAIIFNRIAFPLQLVASQAGQSALDAVQIPVLREGNVLVLATTTLEVAEACSGIRSLVSLLTLGILYGYFTDGRAWVRWAIALSTVPIAILANGARVAGTGMAAHWYGPAAADGFFHEFSGWALFIVAFALMLVVKWLILRLFPGRPQPIARRAVEAV